jgi:hypothetical protein
MERVTTEILDRLYHPVGEITVNWGVADLSLHHLAFAMFKHLGTSPRTYPWPMMFGARLSVLESLFKRKEFKAFANDAKQVFRDLRHHQRLRDMLMHGAPMQYDPQKDAVLYRRMDHTTKRQRHREPLITHRPTQMLVRFDTLKTVSGNCTFMNRVLSGLFTEISGLPAAE